MLELQKLSMVWVNCLEGLINYNARILVLAREADWNWDCRQSIMYHMAYMLNRLVLETKEQLSKRGAYLQELGGYRMFPPEEKKHGSWDH